MFVSIAPVAHILGINSTCHKIVRNKIIHTNKQYRCNAPFIQLAMPRDLHRANLTRIQHTIFDCSDLQLNWHNATTSNNLQIRNANARTAPRLIALNPTSLLLPKPLFEL